MKLLSYIIFITIFLWTFLASALIFDNGSRRAKVAEAPEKIRWVSRAVGSVFAPTGFIEQDSGDYLVKKFQMNSVPNSPKTDALRMLCETELYSREFRSESLKGSGILITPDQMLVPAHLFDRPTDCRDRKIVFNFIGHEDIVPREDVYNCIKREKIRYDLYPEFRPEDHEFGASKLDGHMDYAIIRLDRPVKDIEPARVNDNPDLLQSKDTLYFVSSMRGLPQTVESADIKFISKAVVSTNASTAQGSSGGVYFNEEGIFIGMHISSNPASNHIDDESNCLRWVQESTETFDWESLVLIKERGVERPKGALMLPTTAFHQKLFAIQKVYFEQQALLAQQQIMTPQAVQETPQKQPNDLKPASVSGGVPSSIPAAPHIEAPTAIAIAAPLESTDSKPTAESEKVKKEILSENNPDAHIKRIPTPATLTPVNLPEETQSAAPVKTEHILKSEDTSIKGIQSDDSSSKNNADQTLPPSTTVSPPAPALVPTSTPHVTTEESEDTLDTVTTKLSETIKETKATTKASENESPNKTSSNSKEGSATKAE